LITDKEIPGNNYDKYAFKGDIFAKFLSSGTKSVF